MDLRLLKPGMKIKMIVCRAVVGGKYAKKPQLNGVPDPQLWGHYIMSQVGPQGFSYNIPQGLSPGAPKEPTFPITKSNRKGKKKNGFKKKDRKMAVKVKAARFARPEKITPPPKQTPRISDEESFPALGATPAKSPKPTRRKMKGAWGKPKALRNLSKNLFATVLSSNNEVPARFRRPSNTPSATPSTVSNARSTLSNARSAWANSVRD